MRRAQERFLAARWSGRAEGLPYSTMREAIVLASIVEKETALPAERPHIAVAALSHYKNSFNIRRSYHIN